MIDLHSHILPGLDDGAEDIATSIEMARMALDDGITHMVCTPHIVPGLYENNAASITAAVTDLSLELTACSLPLVLMVGADVHVAPDLPQKLLSGIVPTLNGSRYFLLEPPHRVLPPYLPDLVGRIIDSGFIPIITHPERLTWLRSHYDVIVELNNLGCLMQITAASLTGEFGKSALSFAEKMLDEGRVDILATDAHGANRRTPRLSTARDLVAQRLGEEEADQMVSVRPAAILDNEELIPAAQRNNHRRSIRPGGLLNRLLKGSNK